VETVAADNNGHVYLTDWQNNMAMRISPDGQLSVVAGNGTRGFSGDGGPATRAALNLSYGGMAADSLGNVYIVDEGNQRVRKIGLDGTITTVAGNGAGGFSGDGGPAIAAELADPYGIFVDSAGNLYIADTQNFRVRKVTLDGTITTIAGNGIRGYSGEGGLATTAALGGPAAVVVDSAGDVYIADASFRILRVTPAGIINTIAGNGTAGPPKLGGPATAYSFSGYVLGLAIDRNGDILAADSSFGILRISLSTGIISALAGGVGGFSGDGGPAAGAAMNHPSGVALDAAGDVFIADTNNDRVRMVTPAGIINTIAGYNQYHFSGDGGPAINAASNSPSVAVASDGSLVIADTGSLPSEKLALTGRFRRLRGQASPDIRVTAAWQLAPCFLIQPAPPWMRLVTSFSRMLRAFAELHLMELSQP
jgi:hypothetical protein